MYLCVKNVKIIYAKIALLNVLNVTLFFAKMKILVLKLVQIVKINYVRNVVNINVFVVCIIFVENVFY